MAEIKLFLPIIFSIYLKVKKSQKTLRKHLFIGNQQLLDLFQLPMNKENQMVHKKHFDEKEQHCHTILFPNPHPPSLPTQKKSLPVIFLGSSGCYQHH